MKREYYLQKIFKIVHTLNFTRGEKENMNCIIILFIYLFLHYDYIILLSIYYFRRIKCNLFTDLKQYSLHHLIEITKSLLSTQNLNFKQKTTFGYTTIYQFNQFILINFICFSRFSYAAGQK